ncbi:MAG: hypothetical protein EKK55_19250 [Rhodocyclaceae bacterium]|nr:MAG: hypothetical protein EKK55_19250 [Rhodocyclaceae bacterium]
MNGRDWQGLFAATAYLNVEQAVAKVYESAAAEVAKKGEEAHVGMVIVVPPVDGYTSAERDAGRRADLVASLAREGVTVLSHDDGVKARGAFLGDVMYLRIGKRPMRPDDTLG